MGILDDAIREHLELKRRRGASDDELAKQEAEALGPARRQPVADPDAADADGFDTELLQPDAPMPPPDLSTAADLDAPPPPEDFAPLDLDDAPPPAPPAIDEPEPVADFSPVDELDPLEADPGDRLPPHGGVDPVEPEPAREDTVASDVPAEPVSPSDELDEPAEPIHAEPSAEDPIAPPPRPEPESELDFPATEVMAADEPAAAAEPTRPLPPLEDDSLPPEPAVPDAPADDSDDVLEETPDFLQDTPDHDRLWFEQKPPRDFDFDD